MSAIPSIWNWKDHYKGSTFTPKKIKFNFDLTGALVTCQIFAQQGSSIIYEWKTGVNINVINLATGEIALNQINEFKPVVGNYVYNLRVKFADGTSQVYIKGNQKVVA
jgi:hypothetical protein